MLKSDGGQIKPESLGKIHEKMIPANIIHHKKNKSLNENHHLQARSFHEGKHFETPENSKGSMSKKQVIASQNHKKLRHITNASTSSYMLKEYENNASCASFERTFEKPRFHRNSPYKYIDKYKASKLDKKSKSKSQVSLESFATSKATRAPENYLFDQKLFIKNILNLSKSNGLSNASDFLSPTNLERASMTEIRPENSEVIK